jgi:hypothetical protein
MYNTRTDLRTTQLRDTWELDKSVSNSKNVLNALRLLLLYLGKDSNLNPLGLKGVIIGLQKYKRELNLQLKV